MTLLECILALLTAPITIPILVCCWIAKFVGKHPILTILCICLLAGYSPEQEASEVAAPPANQSAYTDETVPETESWFETVPVTVTVPAVEPVYYTPVVDPVQASLPWSHRNGGVCRTLTEDASVVVVFLEDDRSDWTTWEMQNYLDTMIAPAFEYIEYNAACYGYDITLEWVYYVDENGNPDSTPYYGSVEGFAPGSYDNTIHETAARTLGYASGHDMLTCDRNYSGNDQIAYLFVLDKPGRSYAYWNSATGDYMECAVLFTSQNGCKERPVMVAHEVMHLFGAEDIYAEGRERVNRAAMAKRVCPNDLFLHYQWNLYDNAVSEFTAYTVGWLNYFPETYRAAEWWS